MSQAPLSDPSEPFGDPSEPFGDPQSHLKAQNDLLALKILHEPEFMMRVPVLTPVNEQGFRSGDPLNSMQSVHSNVQNNAQGWDQATNAQATHLNPSDVESQGSNSGLHEDAMHTLSAEVLVRVRDHLDALLPDLIASTLEEVLRDWSRNKN